MSDGHALYGKSLACSYCPYIVRAGHKAEDELLNIELAKHMETKHKNKQTKVKELDIRKEISKILVKWSMPTRQVAILEIVALCNRLDQTAREEAYEKGYEAHRKNFEREKDILMKQSLTSQKEEEVCEKHPRSAHTDLPEGVYCNHCQKG